MKVHISKALFCLTIFLFITEGSCLRRQKRIVGGIAAAKPPEDDPAVFINHNNRNARINGLRDPNKGYYVFKGIRYAEPPLERGRFQRPTAFVLEGEYNATSWGPPCPQMHKGKIVGSEDCLFLNVFTPALPDPGEGYPVLIWIHGGGFRVGAASQYEMRNLITQKTVVVSIQYRLGSLGFLSSGSADFPGNNAIFDMILAANWVKKNIEFFGGNAKQIVPFGHGTGASSAALLSIAAFTRDHFSGVIAMSGSILSNFVFDHDPMKNCREIAQYNNCPVNNLTSMFHCLQTLPVEKLLESDSKFGEVRMVAQGFVSQVSDLLVPGPVVEGADDFRSLPYAMTNTPENFLRMGDFPSIPLLTGVMQDETGGAITGGFKEDVEKKLRSIPEFLNKNLVVSLQKKISIFGNSSQQFIPAAFDKYLEISKLQNSIKKSLMKVAEVMNDAIFNVPAFLTMKFWSKKAKTFFYRFDHKKVSGHSHFLDGVPLADAKDQSSNVAGHGDDLGYIFGENDILGNPLDDAVRKSAADNDVTIAFTSMIAQFARSGRVGDSAGENDQKIFSVTDKIQAVENPRLCEMGLWTGEDQTLASKSCDFIRSSVESLQKIPAILKNSLVSEGDNVTILDEIEQPSIPIPKMLKFSASNIFG